MLLGEDDNQHSDGLATDEEDRPDAWMCVFAP